MDKEIWKSIEGHERYEVSNLGRVKRHSFSYLTGRWEKKFTINMPECFCNIHENKGRAIVFIDMMDFNVDELVARAFLEYGTKGYKNILHKDGDPMNCSVNNLAIGNIHKDDGASWVEERRLLESLYEVTSDGRVIRKSNGHVYTPCPDYKGYLKLRLPFPTSSHPDGRKPYRVHRLVAMMYLPDYSPELQVNHKNGIKTDNRVENLEMVSNSENAAHAWRNLNKEERSIRMRTTRRKNKIMSL